MDEKGNENSTRKRSGFIVTLTVVFPFSHSLLAQFDIFEKDLVIIPLHISETHWCCGVINFRLKRLEYYDSLQGEPGDFFQVKYI